MIGPDHADTYVYSQHGISLELPRATNGATNRYWYERDRLGNVVALQGHVIVGHCDAKKGEGMPRMNGQAMLVLGHAFEAKVPLGHILE
ncbi:MAG TPA: hypothetical protein VNL35_04930 [Chloroflexota bacterium]|nr:hypothetical protein [Chloroflexota bacterium]